MGRAAKLKRLRGDFVNGRKSKGMTDELKSKFERELRRDSGMAIDNKGMMYEIPLYRVWPCQKDSRRKVYLLASITPFTKDDGLLYFKNDKNEDVLVVSVEWEIAQREHEIRESLNKQYAEEANVAQLKPTPLGE